MATSPLLGDIGAAHGKTGTQAGLRWTLQKGVAINAMSTKADNLQRNFDLLDFQLNDDEMARIDTLMADGYRIVNSSLMPTAPAWD
jgi:2,5-diketo-D-gluconate reductase A